MTAKITPVLLSGGAGTRLWPASSVGVPKPFLPLFHGRSTFAATLARVSDPALFAAPMVVARTEHRPLIDREMAAAGMGATLVLEPEAMSTTAAIAAAATVAAEQEPDVLLLFLAADHLIGNDAGFHDAVNAAQPAAEAGRIVVFGIAPDGPHTGYGYIRPGGPLDGSDAVSTVAAFVEKPPLDRAKALLAEGCLWNSGNFFMRADTALAEINRFAPVTAKAASAAVAAAERWGDAILLAHEPFVTAEPIAFDHAVLEKTEKTAVVAAHFDWADVGTWQSIWEASDRDPAGNVTDGATALIDVRESLVTTDGPKIGAIGLSEIAVVAANGSVLVAPRARAGEVRALAEAVAETEANAVEPAVETIVDGPSYRVMRLRIAPQGRLERPASGHTAHWAAVKGNVELAIKRNFRPLPQGQSLTVLRGSRVEVRNPGAATATVIVIMQRDNRDEADIVTLADTATPATTGRGRA
ncbi:mannose-1-phosphate guanylyltransferase [Bauldia sp.]|uniref:mannose-1-phosphate guanylyltransferase n=1 Tax=Bauldia sp. TaxID=2575872 RepID=UPI003BAA417D